MKTTIGIDIGTESVKVVCLEKGDGLYKLSGYGYLEHKGDIERAKGFIGDSNIPPGEVRINIEDPSLKIRRLDLPEMGDSEIDEATKWGLKDVIDGDVDDYVFRHVRIDPADFKLERKILLVAFAIRRSAVEERYKVASEIGLRKPAIIEPNAGAMASIYSRCKEVGAAGSVLVDIGGHCSLFTVMGKRGLLFSRPLGGCADSNLVDQIARDLNVNIADAEAAKVKYFEGGGGKGDDVRLENTVSHFFSKLAIEIQRSIDGYMLVFQRKSVSRIYLSGGGAYYRGFAEYLAKTLGMEVSIFDPFKCVNAVDFKGGSLEKRRALFTIACGLAVD